jgi:type I restriction-modification system DNA methylase subunit
LSESQAKLPHFGEDIRGIEKRLWESADQLRANSNLSAAEYSVPVLGLIFLRYADHKFAEARKKLAGRVSSRRRGVGKADYQARGVMYLPEEARFQNLLNLPEGANIGMAINDAMRAVEAENEELKDVLPKTYNRLDNATLVALLKNFSEIPMDIEGDVFGRIYEYFLGKFAMSEGQRGGEFFTPTSIVRLIVEIMEPYHGRILDPACGSGGMFVQSARFVENHRGNPNAEISVYVDGALVLGSIAVPAAPATATLAGLYADTTDVSANWPRFDGFSVYNGPVPTATPSPTVNGVVPIQCSNRLRLSSRRAPSAGTTPRT